MVTIMHKKVRRWMVPRSARTRTEASDAAKDRPGATTKRNPQSKEK